MISVSILGSGNVATHLAKALAAAPDVVIRQLYSRKADAIQEPPFSAAIIHDLNDLADADVYLLAVSDDAVTTISNQLPFSGRLVVHTSGSLPIDVIDGKNRRGVWYPLQTFSKSKEVDFSTIPICVEAEETADADLLVTLARKISHSVQVLSGEQRKALHVAAVFACNFTNHLYAQAADICRQNQLDFGLLKPLIRETADKVMTLSPMEAQTGPAKRHDQVTLDLHRRFLGDTPRAKLYEILTQSIQSEQL